MEEYNKTPWRVANIQRNMLANYNKIQWNTAYINKQMEEYEKQQKLKLDGCEYIVLHRFNRYMDLLIINHTNDPLSLDWLPSHLYDTYNHVFIYNTSEPDIWYRLMVDTNGVYELLVVPPYGVFNITYSVASLTKEIVTSPIFIKFMNYFRSLLVYECEYWLTIEKMIQLLYPELEDWLKSEINNGNIIGGGRFSGKKWAYSGSKFYIGCFGDNCIVITEFITPDKNDQCCDTVDTSDSDSSDIISASQPIISNLESDKLTITSQESATTLPLVPIDMVKLRLQPEDEVHGNTAIVKDISPNVLKIGNVVLLTKGFSFKTVIELLANSETVIYGELDDSWVCLDMNNGS